MVPENIETERLVDLMSSEEIANGIQARHLMTPIERVLKVRSDTCVGDAYRALEAGKFDAAPVERDGHIIGYLTREELASAKSDDSVMMCCHGLTAKVLVSGGTTFSSLLPCFLEPIPIFFVVEGRSIAGIVSAADINKQPGRVYFYVLVAGMEMALAMLARMYFVDQEKSLQLLSETRGSRIRELHAQQCDADTEADLVASMNLVDLLNLVKKEPSLLGAFTEERSRSVWDERVVQPVNSFRNDIMHSVQPIVTDRPSLQKLIHLDRLLRRMMTRATETALGEARGDALDSASIDRP